MYGPQSGRESMKRGSCICVQRNWTSIPHAADVQTVSPTLVGPFLHVLPAVCTCKTAATAVAAAALDRSAPAHRLSLPVLPAHAQYIFHRVRALVPGLPETPFVTYEPRPGGQLQSHWVWRTLSDPATLPTGSIEDTSAPPPGGSQA